MRAIVTGQIGVDKKPYLSGAARLSGERGENIDLFHVGDMMYEEARDVRPGRIARAPPHLLATDSPPCSPSPLERTATSCFALTCILL